MYLGLLLFFFISVFFSFLCSLWEAVLLSISPSYMKIKLNEGGKLGETLKAFKDNIDRPLAGILTLNTIAHTVGAIGVGQEATKIWANSHPAITGFVIPAVMTIAILLFSEIIPKTIGAKNWRQLAPFTVRSLRFLLVILSPLIWVCQLVSNAFTSKDESNIFSRSDFLAMAQIGSEEGKLDSLETEFINNMLRFKEFRVRQVMTPRVMISSAPQDITFQEFFDRQEELVFSRIPLLESETNETIVGYVLKDELLEQLVEGKKDKKLHQIKRDILVISETKSIISLFTDFLEQREHIALVTDEYGGTMGLVTMEDVVETLLGAEIVDETDRIVDLQNYAKQNWRNRYKQRRLKQLKADLYESDIE